MGQYLSSIFDAVTERPVTLTATAVTLDASHAGKTVYANGSAAQTYTVAPNQFSVGDEVRLVRLANQTLTVAAGAGVTLQNPGSALTARARYSEIRLVCVAVNTFRLAGDVTP